jgi:hypothetical protein
MRSLARLGAVLIDGGVAVVVVVGGLAAGGLRRLATVGDGDAAWTEAELPHDERPEPKAEFRALPA